MVKRALLFCLTNGKVWLTIPFILITATLERIGEAGGGDEGGSGEGDARAERSDDQITCCGKYG
jgi:hypothetical protein